MGYWAVASDHVDFSGGRHRKSSVSCHGLCEVGVNGLQVVVGCSASSFPSIGSQQ